MRGSGVNMERVLVDTNVIVRFFKDGDETLEKVLEEHVVWLPTEVVFEVVFVLVKFYKMPPGPVCEKMLELLARHNIESERELLFETLIKYRDNPAMGLVDCYVSVLAKKSGLRLVTFDEKLKKRVSV